MSGFYAPTAAAPWIELASPQTQTEPPQQEQPPQPPSLDAAATAALVAAVAALILTGGPDAHLGIAAKLIGAGFAPNVATGIAGAVKVGENPVTVPATGTARRQAALTNVTRGAQFLVNAAKRASVRIADGTPIPDAIRAEAGYGKATQEAMRARWNAAKTVDQQAAATGAREFKWRAVLDDRTDARCKALNGRVFTRDAPPDGVFPGGVHPACRCTATPLNSTNLSREETTMDTRMMMPDGRIVDLAADRSRPTSLPHDVANTALQEALERRSGYLAPAASADTVDLIEWERRNHPHLFASDVADAPSHDIARGVVARRMRLGANFGPDGTPLTPPAVGVPFPVNDREPTDVETATALAWAADFTRKNIG